MPQRFLVTGGAGFIGSHLCELLLSQGHCVTVLDDLSTGRLENIEALRTNPNFQFVRDSVENSATVNLLMYGCDVVFHLAAAVGVQLVLDEPVRTISTTIHGTEVILSAAHRFGRPVLITSSSEVYGKGMAVPFNEDDDVVMGSTRSPRWCYAYAKAIDEYLGLAYHQQFALPVVLVRLFNTVGPRQVGRYGMVLPRFVSAALKNDPITVYGDGEQSRCFCHVSDVVAVLYQLMVRGRAWGSVFNLGSDEEVSINELARRVIQLTGSGSEIRHIGYREAYGHQFDDLVRRVPDLSKIRTVIDFQPKYNLDQIVRSVCTSLRSTIG